MSTTAATVSTALIVEPPEMMTQHLLRVAGTEEFRRAWAERAESLHEYYIRAWYEAEAAAASGEGGRPAPPELMAIREKGFPPPYPAREWIRMARQRSLAWKAFGATRGRILAFLASAGFSDAHFYGGVKDASAVETRIAEYHCGGQLDLWDLNRGRIVAPDLETLIEIARRFEERLKKDILRVRNYWFKPRTTPPTPYRALHYEISTPTSYPCEIQLMTFRRDAVCLIDHPFFIRPAFDLEGEHYEEWMRSISAAANRLDLRKYELRPRDAPPDTCLGCRVRVQ